MVRLLPLVGQQSFRKLGTNEPARENNFLWKCRAKRAVGLEYKVCDARKRSLAVRGPSCPAGARGALPADTEGTEGDVRDVEMIRC